MGLHKDIWRVGIINSPMHTILERGSLEDMPVVWTPPMRRFCFRADPFGLWRDGKLHVFVEDYDYRVRVGSIDVFIYDSAFNLLEQRKALQTPWHLSYPYVFEAKGETWMLPEAHHSGRLTLYRSVRFPDQWEEAAVIPLGEDVAVDATPFFHDGLWWLFYTPAMRPPAPVGELHLAYAPTLLGPWTRHHANPVRLDSASTRPGGTPCVLHGKVVLPVQDCTYTYGGAIRPLTFDELTPERVRTHAGTPIQRPSSYAPYTKGMHTLAAVDDITLIDTKYTDLSARGIGLQAWREVKKLSRKILSQSC
ncbi:formyl transferase [Acetobacter lambici]|uniref:Formyl transferase n=1 Tax=Acetobacter lambici TaxID=1332824 RepID=A0ABT1F467_9PROT|nr:formyl transferase [Acetobacter lambici]MCP1244158.1 formyl transferase [Acetobacter lambici]MCP1259997.1 formyl transferase [Acetobacter lambici]NHO58169.1 formyl transferase [Acetobacter lambici]